jgi:hypothetical protein
LFLRGPGTGFSCSVCTEVYKNAIIWSSKKRVCNLSFCWQAEERLLYEEMMGMSFPSTKGQGVCLSPSSYFVPFRHWPFLHFCIFKLDFLHIFLMLKFWVLIVNRVVFRQKSEPQGLLLLGFLAFCMWSLCSFFFCWWFVGGPLCQYLFGLHERTNCEENVLEKVVDVF